jgi:RNA-binding protein
VRKKVLHRIGPVLHISNTKNIILKAANIPRIGDKVIDENLKHVGRVVDIFGPTKSPYVSVTPHIQNPEQFINQILYSTHSKSGRFKRKRK